MIIHGFFDVLWLSLTHSASTACTTEDFDTTGVDPLNNSSNIRLNSKSNSFDVVTVSAARGLEYWFVRNMFVRNMSEKYVTVLATPESPDVEGSLQPLTEKLKETYKTISADIQNQLDVKAEVVQIILKGIDNDIYSTVDACPNAMEMWKSIERLKQGESINVQDLETNLYWEFRKFTSRDGESLDSYYSRFYKIMNELVRNKYEVTNHQLNVQFLL
ncbi:hypothetical protein Tco_0496046 [Tanacetum coccineum]